MLFVTFIIPLSFACHIFGVKLMIDGTINLGPSWNFEYKLQQLRSRNNGKIVSITRDVTQESIEKLSKNLDTQIDAEYEEGFIVDANENGYVARTAMDDQYDTNENISQQEIYVTQLYKKDKTRSKGTFDFETPRKIKDDRKLVKFILNINDTSVHVFELVLDDTNKNITKDKINELKNRFIENFGKFINETEEHFIKTKLGVKKVVMNVVDYSCKLMQRLANRLKIDAKDSEGKSEESVARRFKKEIEQLRTSGYKKACIEFSICHTGQEYSDFVSDVIETLLSADDKKIQQTVQAFVKELKNADVSKIMDKNSERSFKDMLSSIEELSPLELRFLLTSYVFMIKNKNLPFARQTAEYNWIKKGIATFKIIEIFDETIKMNERNKEWSDRFKVKLVHWIKGKGEVTEIAKEFVQHIQKEGIAKFDSKTSNDLKSVFQALMSPKLQRENMYNIPFQIV